MGENEGVSVPLRGKGRDQPLFVIPISVLYLPYVSVPLRGKGRDQRGDMGSDPAAPVVVSVPLRGKGRDQPSKTALRRSVGRVFPSPCGEKVGINSGGTRFYRDLILKGFRPLAGKR